MSCTATRSSKGARRSCQRCRERKARYQYRGRVKADRSHTLCFECYRAERERRRARLLAQVTRPITPAGWGSRAPADRVRGSNDLAPEAIAHRRRMLEHLSRG